METNLLKLSHLLFPTKKDQARHRLNQHRHFLQQLPKFLGLLGGVNRPIVESFSSPRPGVVFGPLPNIRTPWLIHRDDPNYIPIWDDPPSTWRISRAKYTTWKDVDRNSHVLDDHGSLLFATLVGNSQRSCKRILFNMIISTSNRNDDISIYILSISTNLSHSSVPLTSAFLPRGSPPGPLRTSHPDPPRGVVPRHSTRRNDLLRCPDGPGGGSVPWGVGGWSPVSCWEENNSDNWKSSFVQVKRFLFFEISRVFLDFLDPLRCAFNNIKFEVKRIFFQKLKEYFPLPKVGDS